MAIQILVMTDDPSAVQGVIHALEDRRVRVLVHPCDASLLIAAREASPSAILLDVSQGTDTAAALRTAIENDGGFAGVPVYALGGALEGVTSYYDDLGASSSIAAEILAIAELTSGLQGGEDGGLFESLDQEMDFASTLGPASGASTSNSQSGAPPSAPPRNMPPPPRPGALASPPRRESVPGVPMPSRGGSLGARPATENLSPRVPEPVSTRPVIESSGRETLNLQRDLLSRDREILELRSQAMDFEREKLEQEERYVASLEELEARLKDYHDALQESRKEQALLVQTIEATKQQQSADAEAKLQALRQQNEGLNARVNELQSALDEQREESEMRLQGASMQIEELQAAHQAALEGLEAQTAEREAQQAAFAEQAGESDARIQALNAELEAQQQRYEAQLQEAADRSDLEQQIAALESEKLEIIQHRDEALAITTELEAAMNEADSAASRYLQRLENAERLIGTLHGDLGVYVESAHRLFEEREAQREQLSALALQLKQAQEALLATSEAAPLKLPSTSWEAAYNAYRATEDAVDGVSEEETESGEVDVAEAELLEEEAVETAAPELPPLPDA